MIEVHATDLYVLNMRTRFPFRYGIASLTALPHLFVWMDMTVNGRRVRGLSSEGLPPKWFTKDPNTPFRDDLADMLHVIESACGFAEQAGVSGGVYDLWQRVYAEQMNWATREGYPPLLWSLGVSMVERAVIDGFCRTSGMTFAEAVHRNALGIQLHEIHRELKGVEPRDLLPGALRSITVRHTVGLADPLTDADIAPEDAANDGLPQSLEAAIKAYRLTHFKIKLTGDDPRDIDRLKGIANLLQRHCGDRYALTLDGNEQYKDVESLQQLAAKVCAEPAIQPLLAEHLLFVEQPFHRDVALSADTADDLLEWNDRPPMIIDESDGLLGSAAEALESGYIGTSHKNCKGVIKGIANACLIAHRNASAAEGPRLIQSGEDLANVGPVALLQDLAVMSLLGIEHVERNGHHYFKGLSMYGDDVQQQVLATHGDLYRRHENGFATLNVQGGAIDIGSVVDAPFGVGFEFDPTRYTPLDQWTFDSLM